MFVVKYHAKGHRTKYLGDKKEVVNKRCAIAFAELFDCSVDSLLDFIYQEDNEEVDD